MLEPGAENMSCWHQLYLLGKILKSWERTTEKALKSYAYVMYFIAVLDLLLSIRLKGRSPVPAYPCVHGKACTKVDPQPLNCYPFSFNNRHVYMGASEQFCSIRDF